MGTWPLWKEGRSKEFEGGTKKIAAPSSQKGVFSLILKENLNLKEKYKLSASSKSFS